MPKAVPYPLEVVPSWCRMPMSDHAASECWGLLFGHVQAQGEAYCRSCDCHMSSEHADLFGGPHEH
jgi:hypothetical protein